MSRRRTAATGRGLGALATCVSALVGCASPETAPGYLHTTEIAAFEDRSVKVELGEGCGPARARA